MLNISNLSYLVGTKDIEQLLAEHGTVVSVEIPCDKYTGRTRGFALVRMEEDAEEDNAIKALHGSEFMGRDLKVNKADPKTSVRGR